MVLRPLTIRLFGPLRVTVCGEPLPRVRARSDEWLLALLALRHGRAVSRSWLAGTLWPESGESRSLQNLRNALVSLRKALGPEGERLQSPAPDLLTLDLAGAEVDVVRFDVGIQAGDEPSLRDAVEVYTGPLLEGCVEEWVLAEREIRAEQCLEALEALAERLEGRGDHAAAIRYLRRAEALDPLRDSIARRLMANLAASGDPAAAIQVYRDLRNRLQADLITAPDEATTRLFYEIRAAGRARARDAGARGRGDTGTEGALLPASPRLRVSASGLPRPLTPLIGREREVEEVLERLRQGRLVTLIGGGGVGKTRLALEIGARAEEEFPGGAVWVELAPLGDGALVLPSVAAALGLRETEAGDTEPLESRLVARLSDGAPLLALDNCEHVLDAAAEVVQTLLQHCPELHVLATSRQRLGLPGEVAWRVPSLPVPEPGEWLMVMEFAAVRLFVERAADAREGFRLASRDEAEAVCLICRRLDGIPLAIELAAARVRVLTPRQIAARLDDRFRLLTTGARGALPRHQTLRALIDWSYDQLPEAEAWLLRQLAVFAGGWTLEAAEAVAACGASGLDLLDSLTDRSLVLVEEVADGLRYRMLETLRQYALERLRESGEEQAARTRHADYYLALAEQARPFVWKAEPAWLVRVEVEHDNLRAALTHHAAREESIDQAVRLTAALEVFWSLRGHMHERRTWLLGLSTRPTPPTEARAQVLAVAGWMLDSVDGNTTLGKQFFAESLAIMQQVSDPKGIADALNGLAVLESDANRSLALAEQSVAIMRELGDRLGLADSLYYMGRIGRQRGDFDLARACWMEVNALNEAMGIQGGLVLWHLGDLALASGDQAAARHFFGRFVTERHAIGDRWALAWGLRGMSALALAEGQPERAAELLRSALALKESLASPLKDAERAPYEALRSALRESLGESALRALWAKGRIMTPEEAVQYALERTSPYRPD